MGNSIYIKWIGRFQEYSLPRCEHCMSVSSDSLVVTRLTMCVRMIRRLDLSVNAIEY